MLCFSFLISNFYCLFLNSFFNCFSLTWLSTVIQVNRSRYLYQWNTGKWNIVNSLSVSKNNCLTAAQNSCEVNRESAHISVASSACDISRQNCLVTVIATPRVVLVVSFLDASIKNPWVKTDMFFLLGKIEGKNISLSLYLCSHQDTSHQCRYLSSLFPSCIVVVTSCPSFLGWKGEEHRTVKTQT